MSLIQKYNPERERRETGLLRNEDIDGTVGASLAQRIHALWRQIKELRRWVVSRHNLTRWEVGGGLISGTHTIGNWVPLQFDWEILRGNRVKVSANAWQFICNRSGVYHVSAFLAVWLNGTLTDPYLALFKNGVWWSNLDVTPGTVSSFRLRGSDFVPLCCGDVLEIRLWFGVAGTLITLSNSNVSARYGYIGLHWDNSCGVQINNTFQSIEPDVGV